jgi:hypothetical protein
MYKKRKRKRKKKKRKRYIFRQETARCVWFPSSYFRWGWDCFSWFQAPHLNPFLSFRWHKASSSQCLPHKLGNNLIKEKKHYHQTALVTSIGKNTSKAKEDLDIASSHMILACGLPFSLADNLLFHWMLLLARDIHASYKPSASYEISGTLLLDSTFAIYYDDGKEKLLREAVQYHCLFSLPPVCCWMYLIALTCCWRRQEGCCLHLETNAS